jgi:hypothetical protein
VGRNLAIEYRWAEGHAEIAAEFVRLDVDVIVVEATPATLAVNEDGQARTKLHRLRH